VQRSAGAEVQRGAGAEGMVTRTITYTYDPLYRLTGAEYSTGERYEYAYDAVGNRTAYTGTTPLAGTAVTTYTYDAANRLLFASSPQRLITYTWDARGNLIGDGTFTYAYNAAGKMVRAQSITATVAYTYTADGLRVAQAVAGAVTTYAWDWAQAVPELLQTCNLQSAICNLYLIGHETLGWWDGTTWAYILPGCAGECAAGGGWGGGGGERAGVDAVRRGGGWLAGWVGVHRGVAGCGSGAFVPAGAVVCAGGGHLHRAGPVPGGAGGAGVAASVSVCAGESGQQDRSQWSVWQR
jgi:RHS Repeat.